MAPDLERNLMSLRTLLKLGALCGLLLIVWLFVMYFRVAHDKAPYLKAIDGADQITLQQGDVQTFLHKELKGWSAAASVSGPYYPIDAERWHNLQSGLRDVQLEDVISTRADHAADFQVDAAHGLRVSAKNHDGNVLADGVFGKQVADAVHIYFRYSDQPTVYLARGLFRGDLGGADALGWRSHDLVTMAEGQVDSFHIQQGNVVMNLKKSSDTWTLNQFPADTDKVNTWLGAFAHLHADDFIDLKSTGTPVASDLHYAIVTVKSGGAEVTLRVGPLDAIAKRFPVSTGPENGIAWVSEPRMQAILVKPVDLLQKK
jgi:hypothetical protein